jgi:hypothetical protein
LTASRGTLANSSADSVTCLAGASAGRFAPTTILPTDADLPGFVVEAGGVLDVALGVGLRAGILERCSKVLA